MKCYIARIVWKTSGTTNSISIINNNLTSTLIWVVGITLNARLLNYGSSFSFQFDCDNWNCNKWSWVFGTGREFSLCHHIQTSSEPCPTSYPVSKASFYSRKKLAEKTDYLPPLTICWTILLGLMMLDWNAYNWSTGTAAHFFVAKLLLKS